ncbi:MAG: nuclear transport factor 2 family protein [Cyanobacteria bacterium P01_H01_bin.15]
MNTQDVKQIQQLTQQWVTAWSPKDQPFLDQKWDQIFATGDNEILVFDNYGGSVVVLRSLQEYLDTWSPVMQQFAYWEITIEDNLEITVEGDLATTTFSFVGQGSTQDGQPAALRQYGTHIWKRTQNQWRLVHEHLTSGDAPNA